MEDCELEIIPNLPGDTVCASFTGNKIRMIPKNSGLAHASQTLVSLNLSKNLLTEISGVLFCSRIKELDLSDNCLKQNSFDNIHNITSLETLNVAGNDLHDIISLCRGLSSQSLRFLDVSRNNLTDIFCATSGLGGLEVLKAETNLLSSLIPTFTFPKLMLLDVRANNIDKIGNLKTYMPALTELRLDDNQLVLHQELSFLNHQTLERLFTARNDPQGPSSSFSPSVNKYNNSSLVESSSLSLLNHSHKIKKSFKILPRIGMLLSLTVLDLTNTGLTSLPENLHAACPRLRTLSLKGNFISSVNAEQLLNQLPILDFIDLSFNLLGAEPDVPSGFSLHHEEKTNLQITSDGKKTEFEDEEIVLANNTSLRTLILVGNPHLQDLVSLGVILRSLQNISHLDVRETPIAAKAYAAAILEELPIDSWGADKSISELHCMSRLPHASIRTCLAHRVALLTLVPSLTSLDGAIVDSHERELALRTSAAAGVSVSSSSLSNLQVQPAAGAKLSDSFYANSTQEIIGKLNSVNKNNILSRNSIRDSSNQHIADFGKNMKGIKESEVDIRSSVANSPPPFYSNGRKVEDRATNKYISFSASSAINNHHLQLHNSYNNNLTYYQDYASHPNFNNYLPNPNEHFLDNNNKNFHDIQLHQNLTKNSPLLPIRPRFSTVSVSLEAPPSLPPPSQLPSSSTILASPIYRVKNYFPNSISIHRDESPPIISSPPPPTPPCDVARPTPPERPSSPSLIFVPPCVASLHQKLPRHVSARDVQLTTVPPQSLSPSPHLKSSGRSTDWHRLRAMKRVITTGLDSSSFSPSKSLSKEKKELTMPKSRDPINRMKEGLINDERNDFFGSDTLNFLIEQTTANWEGLRQRDSSVHYQSSKTTQQLFRDNEDLVTQDEINKNNKSHVDNDVHKIYDYDISRRSSLLMHNRYNLNNVNDNINEINFKFNPNDRSKNDFNNNNKNSIHSRNDQTDESVNFHSKKSKLANFSFNERKDNNQFQSNSMSLFFQHKKNEIGHASSPYSHSISSNNLDSQNVITVSVSKQISNPEGLGFGSSPSNILQEDRFASPKMSPKSPSYLLPNFNRSVPRHEVFVSTSNSPIGNDSRRREIEPKMPISIHVDINPNRNRSVEIESEHEKMNTKQMISKRFQHSSFSNSESPSYRPRQPTSTFNGKNANLSLVNPESIPLNSTADWKNDNIVEENPPLKSLSPTSRSAIAVFTNFNPHHNYQKETLLKLEEDRSVRLKLDSNMDDQKEPSRINEVKETDGEDDDDEEENSIIALFTATKQFTSTVNKIKDSINHNDIINEQEFIIQQVPASNLQQQIPVNNVMKDEVNDVDKNQLFIGIELFKTVQTPIPHTVSCLPPLERTPTQHLVANSPPPSPSLPDPSPANWRRRLASPIVSTLLVTEEIDGIEEVIFSPRHVEVENVQLTGFDDIVILESDSEAAANEIDECAVEITCLDSPSVLQCDNRRESSRTDNKDAKTAPLSPALPSTVTFQALLDNDDRPSPSSLLPTANESNISSMSIGHVLALSLNRELNLKGENLNDVNDTYGDQNLALITNALQTLLAALNHGNNHVNMSSNFDGNSGNRSNIPDAIDSSQELIEVPNAYHEQQIQDDNEVLKIDDENDTLESNVQPIVSIDAVPPFPTPALLRADDTLDNYLPTKSTQLTPFIHPSYSEGSQSPLMPHALFPSLPPSSPTRHHHQLLSPTGDSQSFAGVSHASPTVAVISIIPSSPPHFSPDPTLLNYSNINESRNNNQIRNEEQREEERERNSPIFTPEIRSQRFSSSSHDFLMALRNHVSLFSPNSRLSLPDPSHVPPLSQADPAQLVQSVAMTSSSLANHATQRSPPMSPLHRHALTPLSPATLSSEHPSALSDSQQSRYGPSANLQASSLQVSELVREQLLLAVSPIQEEIRLTLEALKATALIVQTQLAETSISTTVDNKLSLSPRLLPELSLSVMNDNAQNVSRLLIENINASPPDYHQLEHSAIMHNDTHEKQEQPDNSSTFQIENINAAMDVISIPIETLLVSPPQLEYDNHDTQILSITKENIQPEALISFAASVSAVNVYRPSTHSKQEDQSASIVSNIKYNALKNQTSTLNIGSTANVLVGGGRVDTGSQRIRLKGSSTTHDSMFLLGANKWDDERLESEVTHELKYENRRRGSFDSLKVSEIESTIDHSGGAINGRIHDNVIEMNNYFIEEPSSFNLQFPSISFEDKHVNNHREEILVYPQTSLYFFQDDSQTFDAQIVQNDNIATDDQILSETKIPLVRVAKSFASIKDDKKKRDKKKKIIPSSSSSSPIQSSTSYSSFESELENDIISKRKTPKKHKKNLKDFDRKIRNQRKGDKQFTIETSPVKKSMKTQTLDQQEHQETQTVTPVKGHKEEFEAINFDPPYEDDFHQINQSIFNHHQPSPVFLDSELHGDRNVNDDASGVRDHAPHHAQHDGFLRTSIHIHSNPPHLYKEHHPQSHHFDSYYDDYSHKYHNNNKNISSHHFRKNSLSNSKQPLYVSPPTISMSKNETKLKMDVRSQSRRSPPSSPDGIPNLRATVQSLGYKERHTPSQHRFYNVAKKQNSSGQTTRKSTRLRTLQHQNESHSPSSSSSSSLPHAPSPDHFFIRRPDGALVSSPLPTSPVLSHSKYVTRSRKERFDWRGRRTNLTRNRSLSNSFNGRHHSNHNRIDFAVDDQYLFNDHEANGYDKDRMYLDVGEYNQDEELSVGNYNNINVTINDFPHNTNKATRNDIRGYDNQDDHYDDEQNSGQEEREAQYNNLIEVQSRGRMLNRHTAHVNSTNFDTSTNQHYNASIANGEDFKLPNHQRIISGGAKDRTLLITAHIDKPVISFPHQTTSSELKHPTQQAQQQLSFKSSSPLLESRHHPQKEDIQTQQQEQRDNSSPPFIPRGSLMITRSWSDRGGSDVRAISAGRSNNANGQNLQGMTSSGNCMTGGGDTGGDWGCTSISERGKSISQLQMGLRKKEESNEGGRSTRQDINDRAVHENEVNLDLSSKQQDDNYFFSSTKLDDNRSQEEINHSQHFATVVHVPMEITNDRQDVESKNSILPSIDATEKKGSFTLYRARSAEDSSSCGHSILNRNKKIKYKMDLDHNLEKSQLKQKLLNDFDGLVNNAFQLNSITSAGVQDEIDKHTNNNLIKGASYKDNVYSYEQSVMQLHSFNEQILSHPSHQDSSPAFIMLAINKDHVENNSYFSSSASHISSSNVLPVNHTSFLQDQSSDTTKTSKNRRMLLGISPLAPPPKRLQNHLKKELTDQNYLASNTVTDNSTAIVDSSATIVTINSQQQQQRKDQSSNNIMALNEPDSNSSTDNTAVSLVEHYHHHLNGKLLSKSEKNDNDNSIQKSIPFPVTKAKRTFSDMPLIETARGCDHLQSLSLVKDNRADSPYLQVLLCKNTEKNISVNSQHDQHPPDRSNLPLPSYDLQRALGDETKNENEDQEAKQKRNQVLLSSTVVHRELVSHPSVVISSPTSRVRNSMSIENKTPHEIATNTQIVLEVNNVPNTSSRMTSLPQLRLPYSSGSPLEPPAVRTNVVSSANVRVGLSPPLPMSSASNLSFSSDDYTTTTQQVLSRAASMADSNQFQVANLVGQGSSLNTVGTKVLPSTVDLVESRKNHRDGDHHQLIHSATQFQMREQEEDIEEDIPILSASNHQDAVLVVSPRKQRREEEMKKRKEIHRTDKKQSVQLPLQHGVHHHAHRQVMLPLTRLQNHSEKPDIKKADMTFNESPPTPSDRFFISSQRKIKHDDEKAKVNIVHSLPHASSSISHSIPHETNFLEEKIRNGYKEVEEDDDQLYMSSSSSSSFKSNRELDSYKLAAPADGKNRISTLPSTQKKKKFEQKIKKSIDLLQPLTDSNMAIWNEDSKGNRQVYVDSRLALTTTSIATTTNNNNNNTQGWIDHLESLYVVQDTSSTITLPKNNNENRNNKIAAIQRINDDDQEDYQFQLQIQEKEKKPKSSANRSPKPSFLSPHKSSPPRRRLASSSSFVKEKGEEEEEENLTLAFIDPSLQHSSPSRELLAIDDLSVHADMMSTSRLQILQHDVISDENLTQQELILHAPLPSQNTPLSPSITNDPLRISPRPHAESRAALLSTSNRPDCRGERGGDAPSALAEDAMELAVSPLRASPLYTTGGGVQSLTPPHSVRVPRGDIERPEENIMLANPQQNSLSIKHGRDSLEGEKVGLHELDYLVHETLFAIENVGETSDIVPVSLPLVSSSGSPSGAIQNLQIELASLKAVVLAQQKLLEDRSAVTLTQDALLRTPAAIDRTVMVSKESDTHVELLRVEDKNEMSVNRAPSPPPILLPQQQKKVEDFISRSPLRDAVLFHQNLIKKQTSLNESKVNSSSKLDLIQLTDENATANLIDNSNQSHDFGLKQKDNHATRVNANEPPPANRQTPVSLRRSPPPTLPAALNNNHPELSPLPSFGSPSTANLRSPVSPRVSIEIISASPFTNSPPAARPHHHSRGISVHTNVNSQPLPSVHIQQQYYPINTAKLPSPPRERSPLFYPNLHRTHASPSRSPPPMFPPSLVSANVREQLVNTSPSPGRSHDAAKRRIVHKSKTNSPSGQSGVSCTASPYFPPGVVDVESFLQGLEEVSNFSNRVCPPSLSTLPHVSVSPQRLPVSGVRASPSATHIAPVIEARQLLMLQKLLGHNSLTLINAISSLNPHLKDAFVAFESTDAIVSKIPSTATGTYNTSPTMQIEATSSLMFYVASPEAAAQASRCPQGFLRTPLLFTSNSLLPVSLAASKTSRISMLLARVAPGRCLIMHQSHMSPSASMHDLLVDAQSVLSSITSNKKKAFVSTDSISFPRLKSLAIISHPGRALPEFLIEIKVSASSILLQQVNGDHVRTGKRVQEERESLSTLPRLGGSFFPNQQSNQKLRQHQHPQQVLSKSKSYASKEASSASLSPFSAKHNSSVTPVNDSVVHVSSPFTSVSVTTHKRRW